MVSNAHVKITDISGNVVYKTHPTEAWPPGRKNYSGERARTGVYIVLCEVIDDGSGTWVTEF